MAGAGETLAYAAQPRVVESINRKFIRTGLVAVVAGGLAFVGCSGDDGGEKSTPTTTAVEASGVSTSIIDCDSTELDLSQQLSETSYGVPEAVLPALYNTKGTEKELVSAEEASNRLRTNVLGDVWALAQLDSIREIRDDSRQTLKDVTAKIQDKVVQFSNDEQAAQDAADRVCAALDERFLKSTDEFTVGGEGGEIQATRAGKEVDGMLIKRITGNGVMSGFMWEANLDDASIDQTDIAHRKSVTADVLIFEDGTVIIKGLTKETGFRLTKEQQQKVNAAPKPKKSNVSAGGQQGNQTANTAVAGPGGGGQGLPGGGPGGCQGVGEGCPGGGPGGPGGGGEGTTTTSPNVTSTTTGNTTTTTTVTSTTVPITTTTTTPSTTAPKGTVPDCVPNPPYWVCP